MRFLKVVVLGIALAGAAWMPSLADGLGEANQVSLNPEVAYTWYVNMPEEQAEAAFDSLPDWEKGITYFNEPGDELGCVKKAVAYVRTLQDGTRQMAYFYSFEGHVYEYAIRFTAKNAEEAKSMYEQALENIKTARHWTMAGGDVESNYATLWEKNGFTIRLSYDLEKKTFEIKRWCISVH